jgi:hypothetical protein
VGERFRYLRQDQLRVGGKTHLQAEERGDSPEADDDSFSAGNAQVHGRKGAFSYCHIHVVLLATMTDRTG